MPVIALVELLFDNIAYEQNFAAAEDIGDNELRDARHEHHRDAAYNAGHGERKDYLAESPRRGRAEVARGVEKIAINFYKGIVNRQNHEREIIIDHTDNYRRRSIHDTEIRQIQRREDIIENTVIREQHPYSYYPEQEVYPHGQDENKYNEAAVFRGAFA